MFLFSQLKKPNSAWFLGKEYPISNVKSGKACVMFCNDEFLVYAPKHNKETIQTLMEEWYRKKAREIFTKRVEYFAPQIGKRVNRIAIRGQHTRWGSCSSKGNLNFNWRLMLAPPEIIDYVVVHELCHLLHMNHSKDFWHSVEAILPDYKQRKKWLTEWKCPIKM